MDDELVVEDHGTLEITVSNKDKEEVGSKNHIKSDFCVVRLFVRHSLGDWHAESLDGLSVEISTQRCLGRGARFQRDDHQTGEE